MLHFLLQICSTSRWSDGQEPQVASIRKRGDLQWEVRVRRKGYPTICKTFDRKKDAELWAKEQETVMGRGRFVDRRPAERTTLGSALERYLEHEVPKKKGHQLAYMVHAWMACDLSLRPLASLRGADFAAWRDRRLNSVKRFEDVFDPETGTARREPRFIEPKTVRNELGVISHLFTVARTEWGFEELLNPIQEIKMPKPSEPRNRRLEQDEEERLLKACAADAGAPWLKPLVVLAIETAMRRGELLKLSTNGDLKAALGRIKAKTLVVPFSDDMFFPPEDCQAEQKLIPDSKYRVVESLWAHFAMFCLTPSDREQIDACIRDLLNETVG
jgi:integrase